MKVSTVSGGQEPRLAVRLLRGTANRVPAPPRLALLLDPSLDDQFEFGIDLLIAGLRQRAGQPAFASAPAPASRQPAFASAPAPASRPAGRVRFPACRA